MQSGIFFTALTQPLFNLLVFLYNLVPGHDFGVTIILITLIIKFALFPLSLQSIKSQKALQDLQPKMDELRKKYKDDQQKQSAELMKLYSEHKVNPLSSCLPLLIQLPILIALYQVFNFGFHAENLSSLYSFVHNPGALSTTLLGVVALNAPSKVLALVAGALQFVQSKMMQAQQKAKKASQPVVVGSKDDKKPADPGISSMVNTQLTYVMPVMTAVIGFSLPAGLALYWTVSTLFAIGQQWYIMRKTA